MSAKFEVRIADAKRWAVRLTLGAGALAAMGSAPAFAGDIDGAPLDESSALTGAPLLAALGPAEAVAEEAPPLVQSPGVYRLSSKLQCVPYAREASGVEIYGDASTWWKQARGKFERESEPQSGSVMVMRGYRNANRGHVAVVRAVLSDRSIIVDHANWLNDGEVTINVPMVDVSQKGDWSEVRVWNIPTATWGVRVYKVQGFIVPKTEGDSLPPLQAAH